MVDLWREPLYVTILAEVEDAPYSTGCVCCTDYLSIHLLLFVLSPLGFLSFALFVLSPLGYLCLVCSLCMSQNMYECGVLHDAKCCIAHVVKLMLYMQSCGLLVGLGTPTVTNQLTFPIQNVKLSYQTKSFCYFFKRAK